MMIRINLLPVRAVKKRELGVQVLTLLTLVIVGTLIANYFWYDSRESARVQGVLVGSVVAAIAAMFLLLSALDHPFRGGVGGLEPVAMERTLETIDQALPAIGVEPTIPCDAEGVPVAT